MDESAEMDCHCSSTLEVHSAPYFSKTIASGVRGFWRPDTYTREVLGQVLGPPEKQMHEMGGIAGLSV